MLLIWAKDNQRAMHYTMQVYLSNHMRNICMCKEIRMCWLVHISMALKVEKMYLHPFLATSYHILTKMKKGN